MNILPKKRWHVRTRENIARVRKDEAEAAEQEKIRKARVQKAETEARIDLLRAKRREKYDGRNEISQNNEINVEADNKLEHVNFFAELEDGKIDHHKPNAEHEAEKKAEKEKYEQQIGYLTYLGKNINSASNSTSWYDELPQRLIDKEPKKEIQENKKIIDDPMTDIKRYISIMKSSDSIKTHKNEATTHSKKRKFKSDDDSPDEMRKNKKHKREDRKSKKHKSSKHKHSQSCEAHNSSNTNIEKLRNERLLREKKEKLRTEALLAKLRGDPIPLIKTEEPKVMVRQKYNSQFCPEIARQNIEKSRR
ncbi:hypothetical protein PV327_006895 [Microctonus hyperodae]|uniref:CBF1-interacting co-repressor CIR N-terminal domain-containing protein n=1 Tax=Microctonus hyperodae TaxID=165561 RepID=A0AA39F5A3_MICHY|nr:hypothetical protein PV327_006895 [Microctonus hyperodae]